MAHPVVCRYREKKKTVKGVTRDFAPGKREFHVTVAREEGRSEIIDIDCSELKAVFFVRDLDGHGDYEEKKTFGGPVSQPKIKVEFNDGEEIVGSTPGYGAERPGFFVLPADRNSNNKRVYAITSAVKKVVFELYAEKAPL